MSLDPSARLLADFLSERMHTLPPREKRNVVSHIGAALADSILQAGLNYESVVLARVKRITELFPEAATVSGLIDVLSEHGPRHFLCWRHPIKIVRFMGLLCHIHVEGIESCADLCAWLGRDKSRESLLGLKGVGPKTVDYLCVLVGLDCVTVDRHVRRLAQWARIEQTEYSELKLVVTYSADLMDLPRRQFDWWLWQMMSSKYQK